MTVLVKDMVDDLIIILCQDREVVVEVVIMEWVIKIDEALLCPIDSHLQIVMEIVVEVCLMIEWVVVQAIEMEMIRDMTEDHKAVVEINLADRTNTVVVTNLAVVVAALAMTCLIEEGNIYLFENLSDFLLMVVTFFYLSIRGGGPGNGDFNRNSSSGGYGRSMGGGSGFGQDFPPLNTSAMNR